ncbi:peptide chain release factor 2 [Desulfoluna butyratoxydans]|uniref:peptide chain release factor 2 n=1 Tax=Desulfoluna butyratoxydans TaxID=231438 RepID=UPI003CCD5063
MSIELKQAFREFSTRLGQLEVVFDLPGKEFRLKELEAQVSHKDFWNNPDATTAVLKERSFLTTLLENWNELSKDIEDGELLLELAMEEGDKETLEEVARHADGIDKRLKSLSVEMMLDGKDDDRNAIVSINPGAGGTDSQDWAEMLLRMYTRWCEHKGFKVTMVDYQPGDEAGIKGATFTVTGTNAFGYLKVESGVHRLVRISPFNANGKRQTSFSSVFVCPEVDNEIVIDVQEKDLRVDVFRASGAGGQHVNKTSSAVRITHIPTGIVVQCQQESSQHRNREIAMSVLRSRLYQVEMQKVESEMQEMHDNKDEIAWGSQIRSYVMHPYQMVKDHRTDEESGNIKAVMDGALDPFIEAALMARRKR